MELTQEQNDAYDRAALLCSRSEKCSFEIQEKLREWGLSVEESKPVTAQLIAEKYLDDERFARAYVKDKFRFNHWGRQKIAHMLQAKRIASDLLELAFEEIDDQDYLDDLRKLLTDKEKSLKSKDRYDKRMKLMRFALGRGFEADKVYAVFKEMGI